MTPADREALDAWHAYFLEHGRDIRDSQSGRGVSTNAYLVARRTGKMPKWAVRGSAAWAAGLAGIEHHKQDAG